jgi:uncharacterized repeat protein (TIGR01451 family)
MMMLLTTAPAVAQTVYGLFQVPTPPGTRQIGTLDPTTGSVGLIGSNTSIDTDPIAIGTGITAIAVAGDVYYFIGTDQGDSLSKVYTVDNDTGATTASHQLSAYSAGATMGLWYEESTGTLWGLFSGGSGERILASIDPTTGTVATPINSDISGGPLSTAGGVFTGDSDNNRVFVVGTPDGDDPMLYEVSTSDGSVMPWFFDGYDENTVVGIEWDAVSEPTTLWMLVFRGSGRQLAQFNFEEEEIQLAPEEIEFGDPIGTNQGMTAIDDDSGQFFFIGKPSGLPWCIYTVAIPDGSATSQAIGGDPIQIGAWAGIEVIPGPELGLTKDDGVAGSVVPGDTITYALTASNAAGAGTAEGVELTETVPVETTFSAGSSDPGWVCVPDGSAGSTCTKSLADIAPGANTVVSFAVEVDASVSPTLTQIDNTAVLAATNTTTDAQAMESTPVTAAAVLGLVKEDGGIGTTPGSTVVYTLAASNTGNADALGTVLTDTVPANTTFSATGSTAGWSCTGGEAGGTPCTFAIGTFEGGSLSMIDFAVTVVASVPAGTTQISNAASLDSTNPASAIASDTTPVTADPDLGLSKTDNGADAIPGAVLSYELGYSNIGDEDADTTVLTETVPAQTTFNAAASTAGWVCVPDGSAGSTCTLALGTLGGGGSGMAIFAVTVDDPVLAGTTLISNSASLDAANAPAPAVAADTSTVVADPDLGLSKSDGDISTRPGRTLSYFLVYGNDGNENAADTTLTEIVPANTVFDSKSSTPGWVCTPDGSAGSTCVFDIGDLNGGDSDLVVFAVLVDEPIAAGVTEIVNSAVLDASNAPAPANGNDTTPVLADPDLTLAKDDGGVTVVPDDVIVYTLTYGNDGDEGAVDLQLTETVPTNTTFEAAGSTVGWVCVPDGSAGSTCTLDVGNLAGGGANATADFAVRVDEPFPLGVTEVSNDASVSASNAPAPANASDTTPVDAQLDIAISKEDEGIPTRPGGTIAYALTWENLGNQSASGVVITETVPGSTNFDPAGSTAGWVCVPDNTAGSTCTFDVGAAAVGASDTVVFKVIVDDPVGGGITSIDNTASIDDDGSLGPDVDPSNNSDSTTTQIDDSPPIVLSVDAVPSVGGINSCAQLGTPVDRIAVEFEDVFSGVADPDHLASYMVVAAGPDHDLSTTECGPVFGDDVEILIDQITVSGVPTNPTATLELSSTLGSGVTLLLVCDSIRDVAGNPLDGDEDGEPGGDFNLRFRVDVGNEFANAHLDDCADAPITLSPWLDDSLPPNSVGTTLAHDVNQSSLSGAIEVQSTDGQSISLGQCVATGGDQLRWVKAAARIDAATATDIGVDIVCSFSEQVGCTDLSPPTTMAMLTLSSSPSPEWLVVAGGTTTPGSTLSAFCGVTASTDDGQPFHLYLDALFVGDVLFADGFENGDTSAWSSTVP